MAPRPPRPRPRRRTFLQRWRANFLTGLVIVAPVMLTIYLVWTMVAFVDDRIIPLVPSAYNPTTYTGVAIPGFGLIVFVLFTAIVGAFTKNLFGRQLVLLAEGFVDRMPVVRSIYNGVKQIIETVLTQANGASFQQTCLIEYPRKGIWSLAFISTVTRGEVAQKIDEPSGLMSVFLPTTPNPTSGFLLFVPRAEVVLLDMSIEDAAKLIISAGLVTPPTTEEKAAGLARRTQTGRPAAPRPRARAE